MQDTSQNDTPQSNEAGVPVPTQQPDEAVSTPAPSATPEAVPQSPAVDTSRAQTTPPVAPKLSNEYARSLRSWALKLLLASVIAAATVTVVSILVNAWGSVTWRAMGTIIVAVIHLLIVLGLASASISTANQRALRSSNAVLNTALMIVVASFFLTTLSVWGAMSGGMLGRWYVSFFVVLFAAFHSKLLYDIEDVAPTTKGVTIANYAVIGVVALMMILLTLMPDLTLMLGGFFVRLMAAMVVVDVTLSIVIAVMRRLYFQQHPERRMQAARRGQPSAGTIVIIVITIYCLFYLSPFLIGLLLHF